MTSVESSFRQIREQLITLTVDLEDKSKICRVLRGKSREARAALGQLEVEFEQRYQAQLDDAVIRHQELMSKLVDDTNSLLNRKKSKVVSCKLLMEQLAEYERLSSADCQKIFLDTEATIEREKKVFRAGHEERLQAFLFSKSSECKENTAKALESEFRKAEIAHDQEVLDLERRFKAEERKLREAVKEKLTSLINAEDRFLEDETSKLSRVQAEAIAVELSELENQHRRHMREIEDEEDRALQTFKEGVHGKLEVDRRRMHRELQESQEIFQDKLREMRQRNATELAAMRSEHELQAKDMRLKSSRERDEQDRQLLANLEDDAVEAHFPTGSSPGGTGHEAEWEQDRDKRIQGEIKQLQSDMVRFERELRARSDEERTNIAAACSREKDSLRRRQAGLTEELSGFALEREEASALLKELSERTSKHHDELAEVLREVGIYQGGISVHRMRIRDLEVIHGAQGGNEEEAASKKLQEVQAEHSAVVEETRRMEEAQVGALAALARDREALLDTLDRQIKADITKKDADLEALREEVHAEGIKVKRLEKLVQRYMVPVR